MREIGDFAFQYCSRLVNVTIPKSVVKIGNYAFTITPWFIYYEGTIADWEKIEVGNSNEGLEQSNLYFYCEAQPTDSVNRYWHYVNGAQVIWSTD